MRKKVKQTEFLTQKYLCPHHQPIDKISEELNTDIRFGLHDEEADKRLEQYGPNVIPKIKGSVWQIYLAPLFNWLINIYLIVSSLLIFMAIWVDGVIGQIGFWLIIIVFNIGFTIFQQVRAQFKLDALHKLSAPCSTVIRDGVPSQIGAVDLVPGDLIELDQGDRVPADSRIIYASNCLVNESALTGESVAVEKIHNPKDILKEDTPISLRSNMLYTGTFIEVGRANAIVVNTGIYSELGRLSTELQEIGTSDIPIRAKVNRLAKWLGLTVLAYLVISIGYKTIYYYTVSGDQPLPNQIVDSITTSMAIMPISIPLLTTLILLTGVLSMAKDRVIIRNLSAVETLGRSSVLCSDKTGTITTNMMTIQRLWDTKQFYGVSGIGYSNKGAIVPLGDEPDNFSEDMYIPDSIKPFAEDSDLEFLLVGGMLNNNAHLIVEEVFEPHHQVSWKTTGDPTDGAFLALFNKSGLDDKVFKDQYGYIMEYNFDSTLKRMSKTYQDKEGYTLFCKGATETILPLCTNIGSPSASRELTEGDIKTIKDHVSDFASKGYRVISLAIRPMEKDTLLSHNREESEQGLVYNGFVCMLDPARYGVGGAVKECHKAGVTTIMITGDSPLTARAIAKEVGIVQKDGLAVEGNDITKLSEEEFFNTRIFARVSPQHKQIIVSKYQETGKIVAMTGDGVNDALALTMSDVGICMGITGTETAKQASDVIIADDSFTSTVLGIREGRGLFDRIRIMIFFYIALNIAEAILYFTSSFIPGFTLVTSFQRVYIFSTAHLIPPFAFIFDSISQEIMEYPPKDDEDIFNRRYVGALVVLSLTLAFASVLVYSLAYFGIIPPSPFNVKNILDLSVSQQQHAKAQTMLISIIVISESLVVLLLRRLNKPVHKSLKEDWKWIVMLLVIAVPILHVIVMYSPWIQDIILIFFKDPYVFLPLGVIDWLVVFGAIAIPLTALELYKWYIRKKKLFF
ncbi:MAG: cation-transporting P-type ATPase [Candidatus Heimdallarchaeota archaeon]|nr:cation-transporting P-type ATPase [Candidatus Heimdallarchaeota archaeon]